MTKAVEVITSVQRRRRWSRCEKERIVAVALEPGASASEVARRNLHFGPYLFKNLVYKIADTPIFGNIDNTLMYCIAVEFPDDFD